MLPVNINEKVTIKGDDKKVTIKSGDKKVAIKTVKHKQAIIEYLTDHVSAKSQEFIELLGIKITRIKVLLANKFSFVSFLC